MQKLMTQQDSITNSDSRFFYHIKIIGTVSLVVGALSFVVLFLLLAYIKSDTASTYWSFIHSGSITRQSLGPGMLLAGLLLTSAAAVITWLVALYASFRIAGPLFRFSQNMVMLIGSGDIKLIPIRKKDMLREEAQLFVQTFNSLQDHYREIGAAADKALAQIDSGSTDLMKSLEELRELDRRVRL